MTAFTDLGLSRDALKAVSKLEYTDPTPVQEQAIPIVLEGRDLIAAASTGTGKTAAFLLPILSTLPRAGRGKRAPRVLVVTPTRELAQQIATTCIKIARATGHFVTTVYGGTPYSNQIRELRGGTDVLIATPGRLNDLMDRGVVNLGSISTLVLDEADRMLDMGFLPDVTTIVQATPAERQTLLFSATIDQSIKNNLGSLLNDPVVVQIAHKGETAKTVEQFVMPITQRDKANLLQAVLTEKGSERVLVFARTKNRTEDCAEMLRHAGFSAESIHSDKSQMQRKRALENFRRGKTDVLVATDVLARGIDVTCVDHVINYDLPDMPEDYVHRIGRTGRAGEAGYAISFVSPDTRRLLKDVERLINREIPFMELESYELDPSILKQSEKKNGKRSGGYGNNRSGSARRSASASNAHRSGGSNNTRGVGHTSSKHNGRTEASGRTKTSGERSSEKHTSAARKTSATSSARYTSNNKTNSSNTSSTSNTSKHRANEKREDSYISSTSKRGGNGNTNSSKGNKTNCKGKFGASASSKESFTHKKRSDNRGTSYHEHKSAAGQRQKKQAANISDIRSFGEHANRVRSKRSALDFE